ncbi:MAG: AAA family ATPase [Desulfobacterales bacterium]|uniref:AAA family ATPase n=1 Tax=Candidatus Desulfatibia vada TaxID=2841696 RepID=A0A8J6P098_9BACT|nr:AAA family ATPase [Candidatus Desulfatibia vada]MBL6971280.1 AAA family ATPase [Desulfobacterales bacterium]
MSTPELSYITVKGFKSIGSIEKLELGSINVLVGPNGSGKSNFVGVFSFLHTIREGRLSDYVRKAGGAEQLLHFGSKVTQEISIHISFKQGVNQYSLSLKPTDDDSLYPFDERVYFWDKTRYATPYERSLSACEGGREAGISDPKVKRTADWVRFRLGKWRLYHAHDTSESSPMRKTAQVNDNAFLRPDSANLPAFLYLLREKHDTSYDLIRRSVQRVAPFFDDFDLRPDPLNEEVIRLSWKHRNSDQYFGPSSLSDGTLRFIVLATLFLQPEEFRPSIILIDEPELGLHPHAITLLASLVKQASQQTQVILSTQSSLLLDHFQPEDVLVADRVNGKTQFTKLESAKLSAWLEDYSLGQLWEKNELGGRPRGE